MADHHCASDTANTVILPLPPPFHSKSTKFNRRNLPSGANGPLLVVFGIVIALQNHGTPTFQITNFHLYVILQVGNENGFDKLRQESLLIGTQVKLHQFARQISSSLCKRNKEGERRKRLNLCELQHYMLVKYTAQQNSDCD